MLVGRGNDISHHSIRDIDLSIIAMTCAKQGIQLKKKKKKKKKFKF